MNLAQDRVVIQGIFGTNYVDDGTTTQEFDTSMVVPINHEVRTATSTSGTVLLQDKFNPKGLTFEKLIKAKSLILSRGGSDDINAIISHMDYENLMFDPRLRDRIERGNITCISNIKIYISESIPGGPMAEYASDEELNKERKDREFYWTVSNMGEGVSRMIPVFSRDAVTLGIWKDIRKNVDVLPHVNKNLQLYYAMKMGATRTNEDHVAKILVSDS
ncbi:hypothetical protein C0030_003570 [Candidatus Liberibacter solanacearum]|uniref:Uncharacterized protein n=2 Tax=Candidatus Liberibacter solanacearum TaxID=556287 RepID=A0A3R7NPU7_9HYPH|nr:hypothetical protein C0030_003570 [Candidatus Liberibacter solanacearum]